MAHKHSPNDPGYSSDEVDPHGFELVKNEKSGIEMKNLNLSALEKK